ncbi:MAG: hypothetical protein J6M18_04715 [Actinomycetaceae bacterium]|nr:hypothetical protein [Actinomycetaceae bacterium]
MSRAQRYIAITAAAFFLTMPLQSCSFNMGSSNTAATSTPQVSVVAGSSPTQKETTASASPTINIQESKNTSLTYAFEGYGHGVPTDSVNVNVLGSWNTGEYVAQTSDGQIQIAMMRDKIYVKVLHWQVNEIFGKATGTNNVLNGLIIVNGKEPTTASYFKSWPDPKAYAQPGRSVPTEESSDNSSKVSVQIVQPGTSIFLGKNVCGANDKGLTCWNATTGHGAFITTENYTPF